jgi:hypothetical protein
MITSGSGTKLQNMFVGLLKELPVDSFKQVRTSVISNRLTEDNLREQQIYFGFKYISSIEVYLQNKVEELRESLEVCFPI